MYTNVLNIDETEEYFGPLYPYVCDDAITDIDYNGTDVWLTNCENSRFKSPLVLPTDFVEQFTQRVANSVSKPFHKQSPVLEAETNRLRITIVHESVAISGRSICIRKSLPYVRMTEEGMLRDGYCSREILTLLKNCVRAKKNIVFCGEPGVGKTECAKFFTQYIPDNERIITVEDTRELHLSDIKGGDCIELKVNDQMDYSQAIKTCLRLNPKWMMLSESRSVEVVKLLEGFSTGVHGLTTLHTDDVRKVPDRILNMSGQSRNENRMENDIYSFIDLAVLIRRKEYTDSGGNLKVKRFIDQVCFFSRRDHKNYTDMIVEDGEILSCGLPDRLREDLSAVGIADPLFDREDEILRIAAGGLTLTSERGSDERTRTGEDIMTGGDIMTGDSSFGKNAKNDLIAPNEHTVIGIRERGTYRGYQAFVG
ncbi:MAG: type II/IV secretion system ATPase subunit [Lachnospiraceae bacterium]|nr:type II/IV secretion system ATPase subunit [Lachnospiraceae bacterium]